jgi:hypothetical protein
MNPKYMTITVNKPLPEIDFDWRDGLFKMWHLKHLVHSTFEDYAIRSDGYVFRIKKSTLKGSRPKMLKRSVDKNGYVVCNLGGKKQYIHRLVAEAFLPNPENKPQVAHLDGDRQNPHVLNLRWSTQSENEMDKKRHGTFNRAPKGSRTFTQDECDDITIEYSLCLNIRKLSRKYGVSRGAIKTAIVDGSVL